MRMMHPPRLFRESPGGHRQERFRGTPVTAAMTTLVLNLEAGSKAAHEELRVLTRKIVLNCNGSHRNECEIADQVEYLVRFVTCCIDSGALRQSSELPDFIRMLAGSLDRLSSTKDWIDSTCH